MKLSEAERRALGRLAGVEWSTPANIGWAMTPGHKYPLKPQGAGRLGGTMAHRLIRKGLAFNASHRHGGYPAYAISPAGRAALADREDG